MTTTSTRWTNEDIELLIDWFSSDLRNFELYKSKAKDALLKISKDVFGGRHSASAIKRNWDNMKEKHRQARVKLGSTGEGELGDSKADQDKSESIQSEWLNKLWPYFEELDDVLIRDKSYTPHYVSETGLPLHLQVFNGNTQQWMPTIREDEPITDEENPDGLDFHPPAGGQKNQLKRGESARGIGKHTGAIKKQEII